GTLGGLAGSVAGAVSLHPTLVSATLSAAVKRVTRLTFITWPFARVSTCFAGAKQRSRTYPTCHVWKVTGFLTLVRPWRQSHTIRSLPMLLATYRARSARFKVSS